MRDNHLRILRWILAAIASGALLSQAASVTPISSGWIPGTLIPHELIQHHHGTTGASDWLPDYEQICTLRVDASGNWSTLFSGLTVLATDSVLIPAGVSVVYDLASNPGLKAIVVQGSLSFSTGVDTSLRVGTLVIDGGSLSILPSNRSIDIAITFNGQLNTTEDPRQFSLGLVAYSGMVNVQGYALASPIATTASALAGASTLTFIPSPDWIAGDVVVLPDQQVGSDATYWNFPALYISQNERRTVSSISGSQVSFTQVLSYSHTPAGIIWVGNLTRNVVLRTEAGSPRAHALFTGHTAVTFNNAALIDMGRTTVEVRDDTTMDANGQPTHIGTNQRGRYVLHAHHAHEPLTVHGNAVYGVASSVGSDRFGIVLHASRGDLRENVVVGVRGSGIFTEDGVETGDITGNLVVGSGGGTGQADDIRFGPQLGQDLGFGGFGIWARGPLVRITDNVCAGYFTQSAYAFFTHNSFAGTVVPNIPGTPPGIAGATVAVAQIPLQDWGGFTGNIAIGLYKTALDLEYLQPPGDDIVDTFQAVMLGHNSSGIRTHHCRAMVFQTPGVSSIGSGLGLVNNTGSLSSADVVGGSFSGLYIGVVGLPLGGSVQGSLFPGNTWDVVNVGSGTEARIDVIDYAGSLADYALYPYGTSVPGTPISVPKIYGLTFAQ